MDGRSRATKRSSRARSSRTRSAGRATRNRRRPAPRTSPQPVPPRLHLRPAHAGRVRGARADARAVSPRSRRDGPAHRGGGEGAHRADAYHTYLTQLRSWWSRPMAGRPKRSTDWRSCCTAGMHTGPTVTRSSTSRGADSSAAGAGPRWLKAAAIGAAIGVAVFDAYFFQQTFLNILQISSGSPWWERDIGLAAALVFAIGLIASGRVVWGPIWRLAQRWRRQASPDDMPPGRLALAFRATVMVAPPAAILFVLGWWASLRGQIAAQTSVAAAGAGGRAAGAGRAAGHAAAGQPGAHRHHAGSAGVQPVSGRRASG